MSKRQGGLPQVAPAGPDAASNVQLSGATWGEAGPQRARQGLRERAIAIHLLSLRSPIGHRVRVAGSRFPVRLGSVFSSACQRVVGKNLAVSRRSGRRRPPQGSGVDLMVSQRSGRRRPSQRFWATEDLRWRGAPAASTIPRRLVSSSNDLAPLSRPCQVEPESSRSVEMGGVDDVDQRFTVDQPAQILCEQFGDAPVLVRAQRRRVRRDDHLRHPPQR